MGRGISGLYPPPAHPRLLSLCFQHLPSPLRKGQRVRNSQQISQEGSPGLARLCPHRGGPLNHIHSAASSGAQPRPWPCLCREDEEAAVSGDKELPVSHTHGPVSHVQIRNQPQSPPPLVVGSGSRNKASSGWTVVVGICFIFFQTVSYLRASMMSFFLNNV